MKNLGACPPPKVSKNMEMKLDSLQWLHFQVGVCIAQEMVLQGAVQYKTSSLHVPACLKKHY